MKKEKNVWIRKPSGTFTMEEMAKNIPLQQYGKAKTARVKFGISPILTELGKRDHLLKKQ